MRFFVMTAAAATLATLVLAGEASAVQDTPVTINGVEAVCTGVGSAKDNPAWKGYPVKVVVATSGGADLANVHMTLSQGGKEIAGLDCDAPWVLFKAAGRQIHRDRHHDRRQRRFAQRQLHHQWRRAEGSDHHLPAPHPAGRPVKRKTQRIAPPGLSVNLRYLTA